MAKPTTLDLLRAHESVTKVLFEVVSEPTWDNIRVRFLSRRRAYEITLVFAAEPWKLREPV